MPQDIQIGDGKWLHGITRQFWNGGAPPKQVATAGGVVELSPARRSAPVILQVGEGAKAQFFYEDGNPLTNPEHAQGDHIPERFRTLVLDFIETRAATAKPLKAKADKRAQKPGQKRTGTIDSHPRHRAEVDAVAGGVEVSVG